MDSFDIYNFNSSPENKIDRKINVKSSSSSSGEPRQCKFCDKIFECDTTQSKGRQNQMSNIRHHSLNHFKEKLQIMLPSQKPWQCPICDHVGRDLISLTRHYAFVHNQITDFCNKEDLHGIAVEREKDLVSAYNTENKNEEFGIKYFLDKTENKIRDEESDSNNNYDDTLDGRRRKQKTSSAKENKTEEERRFDLALANAVSKISFWYENGNIDAGDLDTETNKSNRANMISSMSENKQKKSNVISLDSEDENADDNIENHFEKPLKKEVNIDGPAEASKASGNSSRYDATEDVEAEEETNSPKEKLAPPKKTFSMDPFSQPTSTVRKSLSIDPFNNPSTPPTPPKPKSPPKPKKYVDPFDDESPDEESPVKSKKSYEKPTFSHDKSSLNRIIPVRDPEGNYICPKCDFSSRLRVQIVKHTCP